MWDINECKEDVCFAANRSKRNEQADLKHTYYFKRPKCEKHIFATDIKLFWTLRFEQDLLIDCTLGPTTAYIGSHRNISIQNYPGIQNAPGLRYVF